MAKLRVAGTWAGVLDDVDLESWTVPTLREEVAKRSNVPSPASIKLICAGRILKDGDGTESLAQLGVKTNSKLLASRVAVEEGNSLVVAEESSRRLARVVAAVAALSKRHAEGALPLEDFNIEIEDQFGNKVYLSEADRQTLMMGLMLHTNGKNLIRKGMFREALEVLTSAEESFSLCNSKTVERVDNIAMLQIDMVWCYFMLKDIDSLSVAGVRLEKAREGFERSHGKDASRLKLLQVGNSSELALYLRLELLEAVVAFHSGQHEKSRRYLMSAQVKFKRLQVSDETLSFVVGMGYNEKKAKRALRINNQDVGRAVDFLVEEKEREILKVQEDRQRQIEIEEQKRYGVTPLKKAVDIELLKSLVSIGFEKELAAEALRRNENDTQKALDDLTNPASNATIQDYIGTRKAKRQRRDADRKIQQLAPLGFARSQVIAEVEAGGTVDEIMQRLLQQGPIPNADAPAEAAGIDVANEPEPEPNLPPDNTVEEDAEMAHALEQQEMERDAEMENQIANELARGDALSDYDIDVSIEGEAINEYLALLDSTGCSGEASTSG